MEKIRQLMLPSLNGCTRQVRSCLSGYRLIGRLVRALDGGKLVENNGTMHGQKDDKRKNNGESF